MIGNAMPIRYSRRTKKKASLLPVRVSPKKKIRKSSVKKHTSVVDSPLQRAKEKKVGLKSKLTKSPELSSKASLPASCYLKPVTRKSLLISKPKVVGEKRKIRNSIKVSPVKLTNKKAPSKNLDLFDNTKKVLENKSKKFLSEEKQPARRSLRLSKSSPSPSRKSENDLKLSKSSQKKREKHVISLNSELVLTPNSEKSKHIPKLPGIKKSTRFSVEAQNQMVHVLRSASKSLPVAPVPVKVTQTTKHSRNKKSPMLLKEPNVSKPKKSFYTLLQTPQPEKHSEKRKSTRLLESKSSPLRTLNKELPMSTPASLLTTNLDSTLKKSTKQCKSVKLSSSENRSRKRNRSKVSNKDDSSIPHEKPKRHISEQQKTSENFKRPLSKETENLLFDVLTTPAFKPPRGRSLSKKNSLKSDSGSSKRKLNASTSESIVAEEVVLQANLQNRKSADFSKIPAKGTLKYKRWLLNNLKEKNGSYEDDIFENQNFDFYQPAFHFGDESDGSSVNMATPKFDCILTPALPRKTPRYKDCISPTEFLQARKTAEEYLFRRNKKRKSGDGPSSSGKKTSMNKKNKVQDIPEKKKLDFEEAVNKLIAVQKNLETEADIDGEEEDSYFSDASN